jgi:hypothetical protein
MRPKIKLNHTFENPTRPKKLATKIVITQDAVEDSSRPEKIYNSLINLRDPGMPE